MAKTMALVIGIIFVLAGLLGFVSNPLDGVNGLFTTNVLHDLVYIVFGAILLFAASRGQGQSATWLKILGIIYILLAILGFVAAALMMNLLGANGADHWLYLVLGIVLLLGGMRGNMAGAQPAAPMV